MLEHPLYFTIHPLYQGKIRKEPRSKYAHPLDWIEVASLSEVRDIAESQNIVIGGILKVLTKPKPFH